MSAAEPGRASFDVVEEARILAEKLSFYQNAVDQAPTDRACDFAAYMHDPSAREEQFNIEYDRYEAEMESGLQRARKELREFTTRYRAELGEGYLPSEDSGPTMPGVPAPGMAPTAEHGRWPDTPTTTDREGAEPMTDTTRDDNDATESWPEQQMRADFMHAQASYGRDPEDYDPADGVDYADYASRWVNSQEWATEWLYLECATAGELSEQQEHELGIAADPQSPVRARSREQVRYIAEHGIERDADGFLTSHYVTRVDEREAELAAAPLADYRPGRTLADSLARTDTERDGAER
ncbi:hypothetical protein ACWDSJ_13925 [Nocardia sp. NPDC003482]